MDLPPPPPAQRQEFPELPQQEEIPAISGEVELDMPPEPVAEAPAPLPQEAPPIQELQPFTIPKQPEPVAQAPAPAPIDLIKEIPQVPEHIEEPIPFTPLETKGEVVFDKTVSHEEERPSFEPGKPLFVSMQDYREIDNGINTTKNALEQAETIISHLNDLKNAQEKIFEDWKNQLEDVERKLSYVDQIIVQGE